MKYAPDPVYRLDARQALRLRDAGLPLEDAIARAIACAVERELDVLVPERAEATSAHQIFARLGATPLLVARYLAAAGEPLNTNAVAAGVGISYDVANKSLRQLTDAGFVQRARHGYYEPNQRHLVTRATP